MDIAVEYHIYFPPFFLVSAVSRNSVYQFAALQSDGHHPWISRFSLLLSFIIIFVLCWRLVCVFPWFSTSSTDCWWVLLSVIRRFSNLWEHWGWDYSRISSLATETSSFFHCVCVNCYYYYYYYYFLFSHWQI